VNSFSLIQAVQFPLHCFPEGMVKGPISDYKRQLIFYSFSKVVNVLLLV